MRVKDLIEELDKLVEVEPAVLDYFVEFYYSTNEYDYYDEVYFVEVNTKDKKIDYWIISSTI